jgi:hypothetical protein
MKIQKQLKDFSKAVVKSRSTNIVVFSSFDTKKRRSIDTKLDLLHQEDLTRIQLLEKQSHLRGSKGRGCKTADQPIITNTADTRPKWPSPPSRGEPVNPSRRSGAETNGEGI